MYRLLRFQVSYLDEDNKFCIERYNTVKGKFEILKERYDDYFKATQKVKELNDEDESEPIFVDFIPVDE